MNQPYFALTTDQKIALTSESVQTAIELEAANRGIKPPLKLTDELNQYPFIGYTTPANSVSFYEILRPTKYSGNGERTGLCFKTEQEAQNAIQNAVCIQNDGYSDPKNTVLPGDFSVQVVSVSLSKSKTFASRIEEYDQDDTRYNELAEECMADLNLLRQSDYDRRVNGEKRANYMRLAQGNEEIAKAFWSKSEAFEWPAA